MNVQGHFKVTQDALIPIIIGDKILLRRFVVVPKLPVPMILGTDFLRDEVEAIKLQAHNMVLLEGQVIPFVEYDYRTRVVNQLGSKKRPHGASPKALVLDTRMEIPPKSAVKSSFSLNRNLKGITAWPLPPRVPKGYLGTDNSVIISLGIYSASNDRQVPIILVNWTDAPITLSAGTIIGSLQQVTCDLIRLPNTEEEPTQSSKPRPSDEEMNELLSQADFGEISPGNKERFFTLLKEYWRLFDTTTLGSVDGI